MTADELRQIESRFQAALLAYQELRSERTQAIKQAHDEGTSKAELARILGVGRARIGQIVG